MNDGSGFVAKISPPSLVALLSITSVGFVDESQLKPTWFRIQRISAVRIPQNRSTNSLLGRTINNTSHEIFSYSKYHNTQTSIPDSKYVLFFS